jgi:hypothetical protein
MPKTASMTKRALRIKDAAAYLSVGMRAIRSLIQRGELPIVRIAENDDAKHAPWLVDIRDLDALVERRKETLL